MSIILESTSFSYPGQEPALRSVNLEITPGELLLITGHNGAGKSTLMKLLNGILRPTGGRILLDGRDTRTEAISTLAASVSLTFQHPSDQIFAPTVIKEVLFGPKSLQRGNAENLAREAMSLFRLDQFSAWHPYDLPPALRRLLTIASAVASGSQYLAFDEPTVHLSKPEREILYHAVGAVRTGGKTLVIISHDLEFFLPLCDRILLLDGGRIRFLGSRHDLPESLPVFRRAGVRLPMCFRLRPHSGLPLLPAGETQQ